MMYYYHHHDAHVRFTATRHSKQATKSQNHKKQTKYIHLFTANMLRNADD